MATDPADLDQLVERAEHFEENYPNRLDEVLRLDQRHTKRLMAVIIFIGGVILVLGILGARALNNANEKADAATQVAVSLGQDVIALRGQVTELCAIPETPDCTPVVDAPDPQIIRGDPGKQGDQGVQGPAGPEGPRGRRGETGATGLQGLAGTNGRDGDPGPAGPKGDPGAASTVEGPQGASGPAGPAGPQGPAGVDGVDGADGAPGATGANGADGAPGATGATGADGAQGPPGPAGSNEGEVRTFTFLGTTYSCTVTNNTCDFQPVIAP